MVVVENALRPSVRSYIVLAALMLTPSLWLNAQATTGAAVVDPEDLSVEEILGLQVTSVGRKAQQVAKAPAALYVITQEDIRPSGATNIPEVLRIVPGLVVARMNGNTWAISARGGTRQFANKRQVMIDGRSLYNRLFSGVFWDTQDLMLEDIDRIEVIRGTGAIMWGANAVNGVIHIITKSAKDTHGALATVGGGNEESAFSSFRYGGSIGEKLHYRVWGKQNYRNFYAPGSSLVRRNPLKTPGASQNVSDGFSDDQNGSALRTGFRLDWRKSARDSLQVSGMLNQNENNVQAWNFQSGAIAQRLTQNEIAPGGHLLARWISANSGDSKTSVQFWADRSSRDSQLYSIRLTAIDVEAQHRRMMSESNEAHIGVGYRRTSDQLAGNNRFRFRPTNRSDGVSNVTLRDEQQWLSNRLTLSGGIRAERNDYTGFEFQPSVRILFALTKAHSIWAAWSKAVRTPSRIEHDTDGLPIGQINVQGFPALLEYVGNRNFASERLQEWSTGYRYQRRQRWSIDLNAFRNRYTRMDSRELGNLKFQFLPTLDIRVPYFTGNGREGLHRGFEAAASASIRAWWKIHGSYSFLSQYSNTVPGSKDPNGFSTGEEPRHQLKTRSMWDLSQKWQFDLSAYAVDRIPDYQAPGYFRIDTRLGCRPNRSQDICFITQDTLDQRRVEFQSQLFVYAVSVRRSFLSVGHLVSIRKPSHC